MHCIKLDTSYRDFFLFFGLFLAVHQVQSLQFSYSTFDNENQKDLQFNGNSTFHVDALQVTIESRGTEIRNLSGRVLHKKPVKLWSKHKGGNKTESFSTTFVFRITPATDPSAEGLAFILTKDLNYFPLNSYGQWLGIVNSTTNGSSNHPIVAIEFDTKKSYPEDLDNNHVGVDFNSVYSMSQTSIGLNISSATDKTAMINYNGTSKELKVFVYEGNDVSGVNYTKDLVISMHLDLSLHLPEKVYVGFSASTGIDTQLNCVRSWYFSGVGVGVDSVVPIWVWVVVSLSCAILISVMACYIYWRIKKSRDQGQAEEFPLEDEIEITKIGPKKYQLKELKSATDNFNSRNELGRGGFGIVYRGKLKGDEVAVKRVWNNNQRGRKNMIAEITTIGSVHHKNVVKLIGWCYESDELLLVYEHMPNGSLDKLLYPDGKQKQTTLSWERRHNIVCGVAQSIDYLHNECSKRVLHRDIKTSNIMLDSEFNACLGDFGLARMFKLSEKTHHTTLELAGTPAYMAPEIFLTGKATVETDVYAFGVLVLEVFCGRKPEIMSEDGELNNRIVDWVWEFYRLDMICNAIDPKLKEVEYDRVQAECVLLIGLACCNPNPYLRPTIRSALQVLMGETIPPLVPFEKPAFVWPASAPSFSRGELDGSFSGGMLSTLGSFSGR